MLRQSPAGAHLVPDAGFAWLAQLAPQPGFACIEHADPHDAGFA
jgi:hypothetical protein